MSERDDFGSFLMGFIIGGLTGAAVALMMAPQSGEETRAIIRDRAIELKDRASETAEDAYARAEEAAGEARVRAEELARQARVRAEELKVRGQDMVDEQKSRLNNAASSIRRSGEKAVDDTTSGPAEI